MNYIIIIFLIAADIFVKGYKKKKYDNELNKELDLYKTNNYIKLLRFLNIGIIVVNIFTVVLSFIFKAEDVLAHLIITIALIASYVVLLMSGNNKESNKYNIIEKKDKHLNKMFISLILEISLLDRVGVIRESSIGTYFTLFGILFLILNIIHIISFLRENKKITKFKAKKEDILEDIKTSLYINTSDIFTYLTVGIVIILIVFVNIPYSFIAYILFILLVLVIYNGDLAKINREKKKLYNNVINMNQKPGPLYIYQYKNHIETTKLMMLFTLLFIIALLSLYIVGDIEFLLISMNIYTIVIYSLLKKKKTLIEAAISLNEELIDKNKYKINIKDKYTDLIDYKEILINNVFYKIIYLDKNSNMYISESILYNLKGIDDQMNIYINTENMEDYVVVEESYY